MAFKKVNVGGIENLIEFEVGQSITGIYKGHSEYTAKDKEVYEIGSIEIDKKISVFFLSGQLKFLMEQIKPESLVRITYLGLSMKEIETKKGGRKKLHQYKVEVDE